MKKVRQYIINFLISIDQFFNTIMGGCPDETISSRLGKYKREVGYENMPFVYRMVDKFLDKIDANHSIDAIEEDEGKDEVRKWGKD